MKKHIPNLITCLNATAGTLAIFMVMYKQIELAATLILLAMIFDFLDGLTARLLKVTSEMGKELDSLADVISFGVAPAILAYVLILDTLPGGDIVHFSEWTMLLKIMLFCPLVIPAFSAYRLAKFNLDTRQTSSFIGMPTPANALFWVCLVFGKMYSPDIYNDLFANPYVLGLSSLILSVLLISELPMFSLKISGFGWKANKIRYNYIVCLIVLVIIWREAAILSIIPIYILFSVVKALRKNLPI